jgi:DNA (cytosine-5)-methyltransferase 1
VLIGGPPCQAYSLAGRSRNKGIEGYDPAKDHRHQLYIEYLRILADHWPAAFVMENVKGLLSATVSTQHVFLRILEDLEHPAKALRREELSESPLRQTHRYRIYSLVEGNQLIDCHLNDFVIRSEQYGIPQRRHRLILLGLRDDLGDIRPNRLMPMNEKLWPHKEVRVKDVIGKLPRIRSGLSRGEDSLCAWRDHLGETIHRRWFAGVKHKGGEEVQTEIRRTLERLRSTSLQRGEEFVFTDETPEYGAEWYHDPRLNGVCNHVARTHMVSDLHRYLYAACFATAQSHSPTLDDFPPDLLPEHKNVQTALDNGGLFSDRFRVQLPNQASTTITSHIAKDGHYYIHYDPSQCRSLTVREAARLQTFPDNYVFCGPRTAQYTQVGNAVPPLLARQIAAIVYDVLKQTGLGV